MSPPYRLRNRPMCIGIRDSTKSREKKTCHVIVKQSLHSLAERSLVHQGIFQALNAVKSANAGQIPRGYIQQMVEKYKPVYPFINRKNLQKAYSRYLKKNTASNSISNEVPDSDHIDSTSTASPSCPSDNVATNTTSIPNSVINGTTTIPSVASTPSMTVADPLTNTSTSIPKTVINTSSSLDTATTETSGNSGTTSSSECAYKKSGRPFGSTTKKRIETKQQVESAIVEKAQIHQVHQRNSKENGSNYLPRGTFTRIYNDVTKDFKVKPKITRKMIQMRVTCNQIKYKNKTPMENVEPHL